MQKLLQALRTSFTSERLIVILSTNHDKDLVGIVRALADIDSVILTRMVNPRAATIEQLKSVFAEYAPNVRVYSTPTSSHAMDLALELANDNDLVCVTGSLYIAAEVLRWSASHGNKRIASAIEGVDH
jgi:dihydrofolate synthase/folylpolyglutamate synthase